MDATKALRLKAAQIKQEGNSKFAQPGIPESLWYLTYFLFLGLDSIIT